MTCGLRLAGINVIAGVDFDQDAKETYEYNNPGSVFIQTNIKNLRSNYFERKFGIRKNDDFLILVGCSRQGWQHICGICCKACKK